MTVNRRRPTLLVAWPLAALLLAACGEDTADLDGNSSASSSSTASPSPSAAATTAPPVSASPEPTAAPELPPFGQPGTVATAEPEGGVLSVVAVRAAAQQGYDRVVFQVDGQDGGEPGYRIEYVDEAVQDGSGFTVEVDGDATLQVVLTGMGYPFDTGREEVRTDLTPSDTALVREVDVQAVFEGQWAAFIGLDRQAPFRVLRLTDPSRVVVDIATG